MNILQYLFRHPWIISIAGTWVFNNIVTALISAMNAPTKDSTGRYIYWFKVLNNFTGNVRRAQSTAIEQSPNWDDAVKARIAEVKK
jgi:hypothetical protein